MKTYAIFYENADTDEPKRLLGDVQADTMSDALDKAAQYYEYPQHDLVAEETVPVFGSQRWINRRGSKK